ncbi:MAG: type II secretion system protein [Candidatus Falkowbacteria bacterium]
MRDKRAFTALETITAFFVIGLLIAIIVLVINPQRQISETRNSRRISDTGSILEAISSYVIDNSEFPPGIDGQLRVLGTAKSGCDVRCWSSLPVEIGTTDCLDLKLSLIPKYLNNIPTDPLLGTVEKTYYAVKKNNNNRIVVYSCGSELDKDLTISQ